MRRSKKTKSVSVPFADTVDAIRAASKRPTIAQQVLATAKNKMRGEDPVFDAMTDAVLATLPTPRGVDAPVDISPDDPVLGPYFHEWFGTDRERLGAFCKRFMREMVELVLDDCTIEDVLRLAVLVEARRRPDAFADWRARVAGAGFVPPASVDAPHGHLARRKR